jgi:hypothetical protein
MSTRAVDNFVNKIFLTALKQTFTRLKTDDKEGKTKKLPFKSIDYLTEKALLIFLACAAHNVADVNNWAETFVTSAFLPGITNRCTYAIWQIGRKI